MALSKTYKICRAISILMCFLGACLSFYAYYVHFTKEKYGDFKAACDISETMSCSVVFTSKYGKGFGLLEYVVGKDHWINQPNSVFGMAFYALQVYLVLTPQVPASAVQLFTAFLSNIGSVYLAYILYYILHDFCVVCVSTYVVNFILLICAAYKMQYAIMLETQPPKKKQRTKKMQ